MCRLNPYRGFESLPLRHPFEVRKNILRAIKIINRALALAVLLLIGCSGGSNDTPLTQAKKISEVDVPQFEGSQSKPLQASVKKEIETNLGGVHPGVKEEVKIDRGILVTKDCL